MNPLIQLSTGPFTPKGISDSFPFPVSLCGSNPLLVRKTFLQTILAVAVSVLAPIVAHAGSATWDVNPGSGDWNTADNWTPMGVPNGPADTATFSLSNTTSVSTSVAHTEVNGIVFDSGATKSYTIAASPGLLLSISGTGITNNSGINQNFVTEVGVDSIEGPIAGQIWIRNSATAGSFTTFTNNGGMVSGALGGQTFFFSLSTAGNSTFINNGSARANGQGGRTTFLGSSTAANGTFTNNGGMAQGANGGLMFFFDSSTAGNGTFTNNGGTVSSAFGGSIGFGDSSTAGNGTFTNNGDIGFFGSSTAGNGTFTNNGGIGFGDTATAGNGTFTNNGGTVSGASGGGTVFFDSSTAGNGTFTNNGGTVSGALGGQTFFFWGSTAGTATLIANGGVDGGLGGRIWFAEGSTGGTSRVEVFGNGNLDISVHQPPGVTVGSIEGDGNIFLGANTLTVGCNNLRTTFSGVIQDGGFEGGTGGSLTKIGTAALTLLGANTHTGDTNINGGVLQVDGSITSNTFVNHGGTLAGTGNINGNVTNNGGTVSPGDAPGTLTISGTYTQAQFATLMIQIAGTSAGDFSVLNVLGSANLNGFLDPVLLNGFVPTVGDLFTFLTYAGLNGTFSIPDANIDNINAHWEVIYQPTGAILTVAPGIVPAPDHGSTFLLLTLGLLGLVMFRRELLRGQS